MNSKSSALLALLIIIILIVIIACWWSYNCKDERCEKKCEKPCANVYSKRNCRTVYSPEPSCGVQSESCDSKSSCSDDESELPCDPWDKHSATMKQYGYSN